MDVSATERTALHHNHQHGRDFPRNRVAACRETAHWIGGRCGIDVHRTFPGHILSFDEGAARAFTAIAIDRRKRGRPISLFDAQIAAIAKARDATLATRDTRDYEGCGLTLINPWQL
jgi:hypothetical protein